MYTPRKVYEPYVSPFDPCRPITPKTYETPQHLYLTFQPPGLPQYDPLAALKHGTLWPSLYHAYCGRVEGKEAQKR